MDDEAAARQQLFYGITFTIIPSDRITEEHGSEIRQILSDNGATFIPLLQDGSLDQVTQLTHIISSHIDFPEYDTALDNSIHVVKPTWVEQSVIKKRLVQARQHSPDPALIFQDVVVSYGDLPDADRDAITAGVMAMGGMYSSAMTKLVTHIVSLTEDSDKIRLVKNLKLSTKVVLPHWFDDCLKLGKKISETPYILPNPEILEPGSFSNRRVENQPDLHGALTAVAGLPPRMTPPPSSPGDPATPRKRLNVFAGKKIFFSRDLNVHDKLARTLADLSEHSGGKLTSVVEECDVYIGQYRDGSEYIDASRAQKIVGNLSWFYDVITRNRWMSPLKKLLHYPIPRNGIDEFKGLKISLSNYTGDARSYLENVITTAGADFTKTMKQENTHLVTAHKISEKCDAAQEWNIHIINHLWLEESYAKCQIQSLTNPRYTHFPPRTNLSEIVGRTPIDIGRVEELYFFDDEKSPHPSTGAVKIPKASSRKTVRASGTAVHENGLVPEQRTPSVSRHVSEKENEAPPSTARASKMKAAAQLEKAAVDIAAFEKEKKRKGGVIHGRKRSSDEGQDEKDVSAEGSDDEETPAPRPSKKQKVKKETGPQEQMPVRYRMLTTGDERWNKKSKKENEDRKTLRSLGIQVVTDPTECNLLCAPRILRTRKFVMAIASAPDIVNTGFLDYALKNKTLHDLGTYRLQDREMESKYGINLAESVQRAKDNNHKLLRGWTIYVTDKVAGGFDTFKDIVEANGGTAIPYRGRTGVHLPRRRLRIDEDPNAGLESQNQGGDQETDFVYLISGTEDEEVKIWQVFRKLAEKQDLEARIVKTDWILNCAMAQQVEWDAKWELKEDQVPGWAQRNGE
ncbi:BRCT domain-containing protein [Myriangium duriaei CBS 260.36]|uniref:BRCT domain-containing protein n=1 Tax=Myriangium duriaei CBS 260.36 TaxID=1168546 RepID=A0A9P4J5Y7_9PEZI|nr:BRCT domain-containing protein [Myriangium duriaei CBS 260.36]